MQKPVTQSPSLAEKIADGIFTELRSILRTRRDAYAPVSQFEEIEPAADGSRRFYVHFDTRPRLEFTGLRLAGIKSLQLPGERICDTVLEFAKLVWQLKDRLHQYAKETNQNFDIKSIAGGSTSLPVCSDLANAKKHGRNENRSGLNPRLGLVEFDTSHSGAVEFAYQGALKEQGLIVANPVPIPFRVSILVNDSNTVHGDAREVINSALNDWLPTISRLGLFALPTREADVLHSILCDGDGTGDTAV